MSPPMVYCYVPKPEFLLQRAIDKNLAKFTPGEPGDALEEAMAREEAVYDILKEVGLEDIGGMEFVKVEERCYMTIALGHNYSVDGVKVTRDGIERIKKVLETTYDPIWLPIDLS
ncbi:unnamed protein product [Somion occarium]|uniref:Uncharacterized protein n=1 Tax=Somion occarium TaxID=3059160 RepID=A0ABP1DTM0_9APHY